MKLCPACDVQLNPVLTKQGVEVDVCPRCEGIWLDRDEIYYFTDTPTYLKAKLKEGLEQKWMVERKSPVTSDQLYEVPMFEGDVHINYCAGSGGIWVDKPYLDRMPIDKLKLEIDQGVVERRVLPAGESSESLAAKYGQGGGPLLPLPNLALSSGSVLFGMYAILTLVLILAGQFVGLSAGLAVIIAFIFAVIQFLVSPFIMDLMLRFLYRVEWIQPMTLPEHLREFIEVVCQEKKVRFPTVGIIQDGAPQAFTYGHTPQNARIVISSGLMEILGEDELEAVVAHEIGHIVHWDMLVMTIAQLIPMILYYIYRSLIETRSRGHDGKDGKSSQPQFLVAAGAYILYIVSEFIVLWFSRVREYYADRFSGEITHKPQVLSSALVKIGYGLAGKKSSLGEYKKEERSGNLPGIEAMGIFNAKQATVLAVSSHKGDKYMGDEIDKGILKEAARWDLWNPWAAYYELHSTHPLIAKRLKYLSNLGQHQGQEPYIIFDERQPESYWDDFSFDIMIMILPLVVFIISVGFFFLANAFNFTKGNMQLNFVPLGFALFLTGGAYLGKILYSYPGGEFLPLNIRALLKKVKVSAVRPVSCHTKGRIIGRGVPGLIYSEDFVLQDETGIIFLDYQQPLAIWNFFFGLLRAKQFQFEEVEIVGWYRRAPIPYIEIKQMRVGERVFTCYVYHVKIAASVVLMVLGLVVLFI